MATSGTINGTISGYRPYLRLNWSRVETDVGGNRSKLRLQLYLMHPYTVKYSTTKSGVLQGTSFSSSTRVNGTGSTLLRTQDIWVGHNSDGSKTQRLSASFNIAISFSGSKLNQLTVAGDANITAIPRASTLSAFSFGGHLKNGVANSIKYTVDRKSGSFRHQIQLRDGNTTIWTWDNQNTDGSNSIPLTASNVNTLLNRIKTSTTKSFTLRVATRSGNSGSWIGSAVSRNATATVHADVKPTVGAVSLSQTGNSVSSHYLQGKSRVNAKFTRSAGYGASISSSSIQVRRVSGGADSQTINSNDGTTKNPVTLNGSYQARGIATDSRGRFTHTAWATFEVTAYSAPRITNFTAVRSSSAETTVSISRAGTHTHLGGSNVLTYTVQRRIGTGAWTNVNTNPTGTSKTASFSGTSTSTGNSVTTSYDFRMVITDKFGASATATVTVSTQRVVLDIHKNEGVGIGKIHEKGVLDVDGEAHFAGDLFVNGVSSTRVADLKEAVSSVSDSISFWTNLPQGKYFIKPNEIPNQPKNWGIIDHSSRSGEFNTIWYTQPRGLIYRKSGNHNNNYGWTVIGSNSSEHALWSGTLTMHGTQIITPNLTLSNCENGWMLKWSRYTGGAAQDNNFSYTFIPKHHGSVHSTKGLHQLIGAGDYKVLTKYLYVSDTNIQGNANNSGDGVVLRGVYEW